VAKKYAIGVIIVSVLVLVFYILPENGKTSDYWIEKGNKLTEEGNILEAIKCYEKAKELTMGDSKKEDTEVYIPTSLEECFVALENLLTEEERKEFIETEEDQVTGKYHFSLGIWIRNNWQLWSEGELTKYFHEMDIYHPDDMSSIIMLSFHRKLNDKEIRLDEQVQYYNQYWEEVKSEE